MTIFRETDKRTYSRWLSERNKLIWGEFDIADEDNLETVVEYSCDTRHVIDRLNIMGFTLQRAKTEFEQGVKSEVETFESWVNRHIDSNDYTKQFTFFSALTFDNYANAFRTVMEKGLDPYPLDDCKIPDNSPVVKYILERNEDFLFGFFANDIRCLLRLACEVAAPDSFVIQDITELVNSGYYEADEPVCQNATQALVSGHPENSSRIILTEGSTDAKILKQALELLYPHLAEYYSFMEFDLSKSPGGAPQLVSLVKAFSATGITNRIIALFDNDTAAKEAMRSLNIQLPKNIIVLHYPDIELLRNYPTLGPSGETWLDVNGLAGSIELYVGEDILRDENNKLIPVQWRGYNESLQKYQGEVMRKTQIQKSFDQKVSECRADDSKFKTKDWSGLSAILQRIFHAFDL